MSLILLIVLLAEAALAAPIVHRLGREWATGVLRLILELTVIGAAVWAAFLGWGLDLERASSLLWPLVCLAVVMTGFAEARRAGRLPTTELLAAVVVVIELAAVIGSLAYPGSLSAASPALRALLVAPPALLLSGYFGASLGYLAGGNGGGGDLKIGYEGMVARRFLLSKSSPVLSTVTTISVIGVALGVWLIIVSLGVLAGFERDLETKIIGANAHVLVQGREGRPFAMTDRLRADLAETPGVVAQNPIIEGEVAVSSQSNYIAALLFGVDPKLAPDVLAMLKPLADGTADPLTRGSLAPLVEEMNAGSVRPTAPESTAEGEFAPPSKLARIVIGAEMAKGLGVAVGDRIRVISPMLETMTPLGAAPKSVVFEVAGIFESKMYEFDARYVFVALPSARRFLELDDDLVTGIEVATTDADQADLISRDIGHALGGGFEALDWKSRNQTLFSALKLERVVAFVVLVFIILVASFSIVNTLTMSVIEKKKEIAILKTMGAKDGGIMKLFLVQGLLVGAFGILIGSVTAVATVALLERFGFAIPGDVYYIDSLPVHLAPLDVVLVVLAALLIIWDFAVFPALRGSRLEPVEGLRDG